jgi:cell division septation protein DedD
LDMSDATADLIWPYATTLVLAADTPGQRRWAVSTAIELVRKLATQRPKVIFVDLQRPSASSIAATLNLEAGAGMVEILFQGASFSSVARRPAGEPFYLLSTGSAPPPQQLLFKHPRWKKISDKLAEAGAHLLLSVTAADWLDAGPIPGFEACLLLNATGQEVELPSDARRLAEFLAPPDVREEEESVRNLPWAAPKDSPVDHEEEFLTEGQSEPTPSEPGDLGLPPIPARPDAEATSPPVSRLGRLIPRTALKHKRRVVSVAAVAVTAVAALAVWKALAGGDAAGEAVELRAAAETSAVELAEPEPTLEPEVAEQPQPVDLGPRPEDIELPYSVLIASFSSFEDAVARRREWTSPELPVYVAPTPVRGVVYYRVFAGLLSERQQALDLMARLARQGIKDSVNDWDVRPARLALWFGTYPTADDAEAVVETLAAGGVPSYMVPATPGAAGGGPAYHVYAGGYEKPEDASPLEERIAEAGFAGLDAKLIERVGLESR